MLLTNITINKNEYVLEYKDKKINQNSSVFLNINKIVIVYDF